MTRPTSVVRAGHSNWLIGGIAAIAIIGLSVALFTAIHSNDQLKQQQHTLARQQAGLQVQQAGLHAQQHELDHAVTCVQKWANGLVRRSERLQPHANGRIDDLFSALRVALRGHQRKALRLVRAALRENHAYHRLLRNSPLLTPKLECRTTTHPAKQPKPDRSKPNSAPQPTPTVTATTIVRVPEPVPGPTRVLVHTEVRTVTVPPGHQKGHP